MLFKAGQISLTLREWDDTIQLDKIIEMVIFIRDNYTYESGSNIPLSALYLISLRRLSNNLSSHNPKCRAWGRHYPPKLSPQATPQAIHNAVVMGIGCLGGTKQLQFSQIELFFLSLKDSSSKSCWIRRYLLFLHRLYRVRYVPLLLERCKNVCDTIIWEASLLIDEDTPLFHIL